MGRIAKEDFELRGESIRKGELLMCDLLGANRDPRQFENPDALDVERSPNRHVAFGGGVHTCVGSHLAKLEGREILAQALQRWKRIEVDKDRIKMEPELMLRTYNSMPVRLVPK
jgi:cytochrome P450